MVELWGRNYVPHHTIHQDKESFYFCKVGVILSSLLRGVTQLSQKPMWGARNVSQLLNSHSNTVYWGLR